MRLPLVRSRPSGSIRRLDPPVSNIAVNSWDLPLSSDVQVSGTIHSPLQSSREITTDSSALAAEVTSNAAAARQRNVHLRNECLMVFRMRMGGFVRRMTGSTTFSNSGPARAPPDQHRRLVQMLLVQRALDQEFGHVGS